MLANNVIQGPWRSREQSHAEEADVLVNTLADELTEAIFDGMRHAGFDNLGEMDYSKDLALINESIRSYLFKLQERYHPCQDIADSLFEFSEDGFTLYISNDIDVVFEADIEIDLDDNS